MLLYQLRDLQLAALAPWHFLAMATEASLQGPFRPWAETDWGRLWRAGATLVKRNTNFYHSPWFGIATTKFRGEPLAVREETTDAAPFGDLVHFARTSDNPVVADHAAQDPHVLIVPPLSGHYAALLRSVVDAFLPSHDVHIVNWRDAKLVPLAACTFDFDDQIERLVQIMRRLGPDLHLIAVGQGGYAALCAVALLAGAETPLAPRSLTLIGAPIDTAAATSPLAALALSRPLNWFREEHIQLVPPYYPGAFRAVYPGFMQLQDRMALSFDGGLVEQAQYFDFLTRGDEDPPEAHEELYEEFLAVMDVPAELYLQFIETAYQKNALAAGTMTWRGKPVSLAAIRETAILSVEGDMDDLTPPGQTRAALDLCVNLPPERKQAHLEIDVGTYGLFSGRKWRNNIQPVIHAFIRTFSLAAE